MLPRYLMLTLLVFLSMIVCEMTRARAETGRNWASLAKIKKIAIVPAFFCEELRREANDGARRMDLHQLEEAMNRAIYTRLKEQVRYRIYPSEHLLKVMKTLEISPSDLLMKADESKKETWAKPRIFRLKQLAKALNVDAIFVGQMHPPSSIGDSAAMSHGIVNPLQIGIKRIRPHVVSPRIQGYLVAQNGDIVWKDEQMSDHPRTSPKTMKTLMLDWREATDQAACQLTDSLLRLPPMNAKSSGKSASENERANR